MKSIRTRVVVWYLALLAALLIGLCVVQTVTLTGYLSSSEVRTMEQEASQGLAYAGTCYFGSSASLRQQATAAAQLLGSDGVGATVVSPTGQTLATYVPDSNRVVMPPAASPAIVRNLTSSGSASYIRAGLAKGTCRTAPLPSLSTAAHLRSGSVLYLSVPLGRPGHTVAYAILSRSTAAEDATLQRARLTLILGAIAVLLIAAVVASPVINRALRPLHRVTYTAEAIASGHLEQRANLAVSTDEIARLGKAFDTMVDRLQGALFASTASEERMRRFVADASHELRTPLTVLRGTSQLLLRHKVLNEEEMASAVIAIRDESERLTRLVDDLLTLSKVDAGVELAPRPVRVSEFLRDFIERYGAAWPERSIQIQATQFDGAHINIDPEAFRRVLTNLLDNAARYSRPGGPITVIEQVDTDSVSVLVKDSGPGLSPEDAEHAFERFYRGNKSRARATGGSGLGLAIVHALIEKSGGEIRIDTGLDRGTTVAVTLPLLPAPARLISVERGVDRPRELAGATG